MREGKEAGGKWRRMGASDGCYVLMQISFKREGLDVMSWVTLVYLSMREVVEVMVLEVVAAAAAAAAVEEEDERTATSFEVP